MKRFAWVVSLVLVCSVACADEPPSLNDAITRALACNPEVAMAKTNVAYADAKLRSARRGAFHPELRVSAGDNAITGTTRASVQVSQDLMRLLTFNGDEVRQAEHDLAVARQTLAITQQRVIHQVVEAFGHLRMTEDVVQMNAEALDAQCTLLAFANAQFNAGAGTLEHCLSVQQAMVSAQLALRQAEGDHWQAQVVLSQLLGDPLPTREVSP